MHRITRWGSPVPIMALVLLLSGCDSILGPGDDPASIEITGSRYTLDLIGDTVQLTPVVRTESGKVLSDASVTWVSRQVDVAVVSGTGVVTGRGNGDSWIVASSGGARDSVRVTVASPIPCAPAGEIVLPDTVSGSVSGTDCRPEDRYVDAWILTLEEQTEVTVQLASSAFDAVLGLLDGSGAVIQWDDDGGQGTNSLITTTLNAGTYFLYASSFYGGETGSYQLMIQEGVPPSPCPATASVAIGDTVTGATTAEGCVLEGHYLDVWRLNLAADTTIIVQVDSDDFDAALAVSDTFGRFLNGSGDGPGTSAWLEIFLLAGSYDVWVGAGTQPSTPGTYTLSVLPGPVFRVCQPVGVLGFPGSVAGELTGEDCFVHTGPGDPWSMELTAPTVVELSLASEGFSPLVLVTDSVGTLLRVLQGDSAYVEGDVSLEAGRYTVWALAGEDGRGAYTLAASPAGQMIDCEASGSIALADTVAGSLSTTDCRLPDGRYADVWTTRLDTASAVRVTVGSDKFDAFLIVADSTGVSIAENNDSGSTNAALTLDLPAGLYQLWATSFGADAIGGYELGLVSAASASAAPALPSSFPAGIPDLREGRRPNTPEWRPLRGFTTPPALPLWAIPRPGDGEPRGMK